eukprot:1152209-Pelagomonas_calceolata.AAC.8
MGSDLQPASLAAQLAGLCQPTKTKIQPQGPATHIAMRRTAGSMGTLNACAKRFVMEAPGPKTCNHSNA